MGRALFTSIPKCGKNLGTALFEALGIARLDHPAEREASAHVMARWTKAARTEGRRPQPAYDDGRIDAYVVATRPALESLTRDLASLPDGCYIHAHLGFDDALASAASSAGVPIIFLYRDPGAMLASQAHFLIERGEPADLLPRLESRSLESAYRLLIEGDETTLSADESVAVYEGWLSASGILPVRFEDLVGMQGGGSAEVQLATVARIAQHVGWSGPTAALVDAAEKVFNSRAGTFRRGTIHGWRHDVPAEVIGAYPEFFGGLARRWGYDGSDARSACTASDAAAPAPSLRVALDRALADSADRLALIHRLNEALRTNAAERDRLSKEGDDRLVLIRRLHQQLTEAVAERDRLSKEGDDRLAVIRRLEARLADLQCDSNGGGN